MKNKKMFAVGLSVALAFGSVSAFAMSDSQEATRAEVIRTLWTAEKEPVVNYIIPYTDVSGSESDVEAVRWAASQKIISGEKGNIYPKKNVTRAEIVDMLYHFANVSKVDTSSFEDTNILSYKDAVSLNEHVIPAFQWACGAGIISGYDNGMLGYADNVTREQFAAILYRYAELIKHDVSVGENTNVLSFNDTFNFSEYAIPAIKWACGDGIISGYDNGNFGNRDFITKEQIVTMLYRFAKVLGVDTSVGADTNILSYNDASEISEYAIPAMQWAYGTGISDMDDNSKFYPNDKITREDFAKIIYGYAKQKGLDISVGEDTNILSYNDFADIDEDAIAAMQYVCGMGFLTADEKGNILPDAGVIRADVENTVYELTGAKPEVTSYVSWWKIGGDLGSTLYIGEKEWKCYNDDGKLYDDGTVSVIDDSNVELYNQYDKLVAKAEIKGDTLSAVLYEEMNKAFGEKITCKKIENPYGDNTQISVEKAVEILENLEAKKIGLPVSAKEYEIMIFEDEWIYDNDCYVLGVYAYLENRQQLMATFAVSKDGEHIYKSTDGQYEEIK